jgi:hypothetical protein
MTDNALEEAKSELCKLRLRIADLEQIKGFATKGNHMDNITINLFQVVLLRVFVKS